nr:hypothetical protein [Tanacetum cinerariifolium]
VYWETATYDKIYDGIDLFKDFEAYFSAIIYNDALTSDLEVSYEPTVNPHNAIKADFDFTISFSEADDKDYTFIYDKNSSCYKLISANDLKLDTGNDIDEINVKLPSEDISIKLLDSVINVNVDTYSQAFDKSIETNHDTPYLSIRRIHYTIRRIGQSDPYLKYFLQVSIRRILFWDTAYQLPVLLIPLQ